MYLIASIFGICGPLIQGLRVNHLGYQFLSLTLVAIANSIQKPLMVQLATFLADTEEGRNNVNRFSNFINYLGILGGYILSGIMIKYFSYQICFFINSITFIVFAITVSLSKFPSKINITEETTFHSIKSLKSSLQTIFHSRQLMVIFILTLSLWLVGGSINVLEIPFAKKILKVTDAGISLLFFASALGSILYCILPQLNYFKYKISLLPFVVAISAGTIAIYVGAENYYLALVLLVIFGYFTSLYNVESINALQKTSPPEQIENISLLFSSTIQFTTLFAAAMGVLIARGIGEKWACILFSMLAMFVALSSSSILSFNKKHEGH